MQKYACRLCERFTLTDGITFTGGNLVINLPAGSYDDCNKYCIVIADAIPATVTRGAPVFFTIGGGAVLYPFNDACGRQLTQEDIATRWRYVTKVRTTATGGSFNLLGRRCCYPVERLAAIDGTAPAAEGGVGA